MTAPERVLDIAAELNTTQTKARRAADILDTIERQVWGNPDRPGSGLDLHHPAAPLAVGAVLAGACSSLASIGLDPKEWTK